MGFYNHNQIKCFLKVAELGNFTLAAHNLHLTTTAISKQIKNLEQNLREQLFQRSTRQVKLTEFGILFYQRCKLIANEIESIEHFVESSKEIPQGELKILVSTITSKDWILKHLHSFMNHYPKINLEIIFSEEDADLARDDIDIMVGFPVIPPVTEALKYKKLFQTNNILCGSKEFIAYYGKPETANELLHYKIISHTLRKPANFLPLANGNQLPCANPILYMNNFDALNQACLAGIGLFLTGDTLVKHWLESGDLIQVLPQYQFRQYEIFIFYRAYNYELPKIRVFLNFFSKT
ncbi:LysR family transcriptional regulator [Legionella gresilensis]|uniref:LysR family transcriptional regulator n=1 Tax=Legionella gresilensis TaxID=91823 RepID=UPI0010413EF6|nr:LysR family transcriptional regulator [Legionella gresilensis]